MSWIIIATKYEILFKSWPWFKNLIFLCWCSTKVILTFLENFKHNSNFRLHLAQHKFAQILWFNLLDGFVHTNIRIMSTSLLLSKKDISEEKFYESLVLKNWSYKVLQYNGWCIGIDSHPHLTSIDIKSIGQIP